MRSFLVIRLVKLAQLMTPFEGVRDRLHAVRLRMRMDEIALTHNWSI